MTQYKHIPVLLAEVVEHLRPEPNETFIDGTVGQGGHAEIILEHLLPGGRLLAMDRDPVNLQIAKENLVRFGKNVVYVNDSYASADEHAQAQKFEGVDGILLDLGYSSLHIEDATRGFSFMKDGPLDMRYDTHHGESAQTIVKEWNEEQLARIFRIYGEEPKAREIAKAIILARKRAPIKTTLELANIVSTVVYAHGPTHPATKVFQALRIAVNDELGELELALPRCVGLLKPGGRFAVITFHSLEDRIVKNFFRSCSDLELETKKPIAPSREEIKSNPRSRSAKLRVAVKK